MQSALISAGEDKNGAPCGPVGTKPTQAILSLEFVKSCLDATGSSLIASLLLRQRQLLHFVKEYKNYCPNLN